MFLIHKAVIAKIIVHFHNDIALTYFVTVTKVTWGNHALMGAPLGTMTKSDCEYST